MLKTKLTEAVNGWVVEITLEDKTDIYIYERLVDAQNHRNAIERDYGYGLLKEKEASL